MDIIKYEKGEGDSIGNLKKLKPAVRLALEKYFEDLPIGVPVDMKRVAKVTNQAFGPFYRYGLSGLWFMIGGILLVFGYFANSFFLCLLSFLPLLGGYGIISGKSMNLDVLYAVELLSLKQLGLEPKKNGVERDMSLLLRDRTDLISDSISDLFTGKIENYPVETFYYIREHGDKRGKKYHDGVHVTRIKFDTTFPHCVVTNTNFGELSAKNLIKLHVLGNLEEKCSVYATDEYKIEAIQLFPPDMLENLFGEKGYFKKRGLLTERINIEAVDHYLLIIQPLGNKIGGGQEFVRAVAELLQINGRDFAKFIDVPKSGYRYLS
jgi:hypothetical protein